MTTCNLTKLETALDQIKKGYPKLVATDAALIATALSLSGRHALAMYEENAYRWPDDYQKLSGAMLGHIRLTQDAIEANQPKKMTKAAVAAQEDEPVVIGLGLKPNLEAAEEVLGDREDLKALLSDILKEGVEFVYSPSDIGWQWSIERVNWSTVTDSDISRRIRVKTAFTEGAVGVETGAAKKRASSKKTVAAPVQEAPVAPEIEE